MTYISAQVTENKKNVIVWERDSNGERDYRVFPAPYYFYVPDEDGKYEDIYGKKLTKLELKNSYEFYQMKEECKKSGLRTYESDIGPEYKILSKHYYNKPVGKLNVTFLDIEVDKDPNRGYATINDPYAEIVSVALYHQYNNRMVVYAVPPDNTWNIDKISDDVKNISEVILCKNEEQLLKCFLAEIDNSDILSGWNSSMYDMPYIYARLEKMGEQYARQLSFPNAKPPKYREIEKFNVMQKTVVIYGRVSLDYLDVFIKLEASMRPSNALEAIAEELLPDLPKLSYDGALHDLYRNDFNFFLRYNIRDTEILKGFEEKLKYVDFSVDFSHLATGLIENVLGTVKLSDMAFINECHYVLNKIVPDVNTNVVTDGKYAGALVLDPQIGMHEDISAVDVVSLYPSTIRSFNISPETIIGQFVEKYKAYDAIKNGVIENLTMIYENGNSETKSTIEWKTLFKLKNWCVSGYGTIYTQEFQGFIPTVIAEWFEKRKEYKRTIKKIDKKIQNILDKYKK